MSLISHLIRRKFFWIKRSYHLTKKFLKDRAANPSGLVKPGSISYASKYVQSY